MRTKSRKKYRLPILCVFMTCLINLIIILNLEAQRSALISMLHS